MIIPDKILIISSRSTAMQQHLHPQRLRTYKKLETFPQSALIRLRVQMMPGILHCKRRQPQAHIPSARLTAISFCGDQASTLCAATSNSRRTFKRSSSALTTNEKECAKMTLSRKVFLACFSFSWAVLHQKFSSPLHHIM